MHPKVADIAVFGIPHEDLGAVAHGVVVPATDAEPGPRLAEELLVYLHERLATYKCSRAIDFEPELPRHPTGKLYKRLLRDRYTGEQVRRNRTRDRQRTAAPGNSESSTELGNS
ncbi:AMP-binding enzyme [Nocardia nova]|uniref:AMP-binding enzyme n=1 Tax=Nocardia nova TaxID=37330 RepID=UPI003183F953